MGTLSRDVWVAKLVRNAQRAEDLPSGWWGAWEDCHGPNGERVRDTTRKNERLWEATTRSGTKSLHTSRVVAIHAARQTKPKRKSGGQ